jgi:dTDP-4-amino-4,6-dideoxygalactose transaminase
MRFNNINRQYKAFQDEMDQAYLRVMNSGWVILGDEVKSFEQEFAEYTESKYCVGVASGMDALIIALKSCGIGTGDEVIVPANTYIASWLAIEAVGATIVPVEPDETYCIDPERIEITDATRAIMPVHLFGGVCDLEPIEEIAMKNGLKIIHDAAQAHGARYKGKRIGGQMNAVAWSFYPTKNLGAMGDAGAITTDDLLIAEYARLMRNYGSPKKYYNTFRGMNSRLDELQAAFLRVKLEHLDEMNKRRWDIALKYFYNINVGLELILPHSPRGAHVFHQFVVRHPERDALAKHLEKNGVPTLIHYPIPPHLSGAYCGGGELGVWKPMVFPITENYADTMLSLPIDPFLTDEEVDHVIETINGWKQ